MLLQPYNLCNIAGRVSPENVSLDHESIPYTRMLTKYAFSDGLSEFSLLQLCRHIYKKDRCNVYNNVFVLQVDYLQSVPQ